MAPLQDEERPAEARGLRPLSRRSGSACRLGLMSHRSRAGSTCIRRTMGALLAWVLLPAIGWPAGEETRAIPQDQASPPLEGATAEPDRQPGLLRQIAGDFGRFASRDTLIALGVGGGLSLAALPHDRRITEAASRSARLDAFFEFGAVSGDGWVQGGGAMATYALGRLAHQPRITGLGRDLNVGLRPQDDENAQFPSPRWTSSTG